MKVSKLLFQRTNFWFLKSKLSNYYCVLKNEKLHTSHSNNLMKANIMIIHIFPIYLLAYNDCSKKNLLANNDITIDKWREKIS